jgi:hypothetical protein
MDWIILRCAGRSTLPLAESLAEDGFEVWTPVETIKVNVPRMTVKREARRPIMPSYAFAGVAHLVDLLQLAAMPVKPRRGAGFRLAAHPDFSVLHAFGRIPMVADRHLDELRKLEARRTPRKIAAYAYPKNQQVRVKPEGGSTQGKVGIVIRSTPAKTQIICTGDRYPIEIPTSFLEPDSLEEPRLVVRLAA